MGKACAQERGRLLHDTSEYLRDKRLTIACVYRSCMCVWLKIYIPQNLKAPLHVEVRKSAVFATYPLSYLQAFNAAPYERIEVTGMGKNHRTCEDKSTDSSPTCGWHLSAQTGERLRDSQGFCCGCSMSNAVDESIDGSIDGSGMSGGGGTEFRARLDCNVFRTGLPLQAAAHCMTHGDEWYSGYAVGTAHMDFDIFVDARVGEGEDMRNSTLRLGPDVALNRYVDSLILCHAPAGTTESV